MVIQAFVNFIKFFASAFNEFLDKNGPYMAAAISFYAFFALFPLTLALISVFGFILGIEGFSEQLVEGLQRQVPVLNEAGDLIVEVLEGISEGRAVSSTLAAIGLFWASSAVFGSIRKSINAIWGIRKTRPFLQERAIDFALMFGAASLLFASVFITTALSFFQYLSAIWLPDAPISDPALWQRIAFLVPPFLSFIVFLVLYWWLPNTKLTFREVWPTALLGAIAFEISKAVFVLYLQNVGGLSNVYGTVGAVIALMAFVYVSAIIMLVGAMLTSRYVYYLAMKEQRQQNERLSRNLERIRSMSSLPGLPAPVPLAPPSGSSGERPDWD